MRNICGRSETVSLCVCGLLWHMCSVCVCVWLGGAENHESLSYSREAPLAVLTNKHPSQKVVNIAGSVSLVGASGGREST